MYKKGGSVMKKRFNYLSIISLLFCFAPILIWLLAPLSDVFTLLFFLSFWGVGFAIVGITTSVISLCVAIRKKSRTELIISILSIIMVFCWGGYFLYYWQGGELFA
jgi:hypothetical protein